MPYKKSWRFDQARAGAIYMLQFFGWMGSFDARRAFCGEMEDELIYSDRHLVSRVHLFT